MSYEALLKQPLSQREKEPLFRAALIDAYCHHLAACPPFRRFCERRKFDPEGWERIEELPFLPAALFKRRLLSSVAPGQQLRIVNSSATSGQRPSRIPIDQVTSSRQSRTLLWLLADLLGKERLPFYLLSEPSMGEGGEISARSAALRGFLMAASSVTVIDCPEQLGPGVLLGYPSQLYRQLLLPLGEARLSLPELQVVHFGGWKREEGGHPAQLRALFEERLGVSRVVDLYGLTEQLGIVYADVGDRARRVPSVSEVVVRDLHTLCPVADGAVGLLQLITPLPRSYPGLSLLLDDLGRIVRRDEQGVAFELLGRAERAERRGCGL